MDANMVLQLFINECDSRVFKPWSLRYDYDDEGADDAYMMGCLLKPEEEVPAWFGEKE